MAKVSSGIYARETVIGSPVTAAGSDGRRNTLLQFTRGSLDRTDEAGVTLREIGDMVRERKRIVVGDETLFLERANPRGLERPTIKSIASILATFCRDAAFAERLKALALQE